MQTAKRKNYLRPKALHCLILSVLLAQVFDLRGQVTATFRGDSAKVEIGDHLNMKLVINAGPDVLIDFPRFEGDTIGKIDILKKGKIDTAKLGDKTIYSQDITVSAYEEGQYVFTPSKIYYFNKTNNSVDSVYTNSWVLDVATIPVDTTKPIKPIKAPLKVDYKINEFLGWIILAIVLLILLLIGLILYFRHKNKPAPVVTRPRPKEPAHIWAAKELKKLEEEKLWQKDEVKQFYSRLTDILRLYLEYRFDYYAMEATTEEIREKTGNLEIRMDASARLMEVLRLADFVKFAKMTPAPDQNVRCMQDAFAFVEITKPALEESVNTSPKN